MNRKRFIAFWAPAYGHKWAGTIEDTARSLSLQKQGLYATIRALGSLPSVALSCPMAVALYPFMLLPQSVKSKRVTVFFLISSPTLLDESHFYVVRFLLKNTQFLV